ncbi:RNA polymerase sigma factor [Filimonas lacunae]|uniref:RNA polymerase sigma factor n=1 Tax=Filimonas lacunae TaxID=477680 RepID=UPI00135659AA|nr:sigma factor [Filimonas lacunae]
MSYDEPELLSLSSQGEEQAFTRLLQMHKHKLYSFVRHITDSDTEAELAIQQIIATLWHQREQLAAVEEFDNYLFTVTVQQLLPAHKKATRTSTTVSAEKLSWLASQSFDNTGTAEDRAAFIAHLHDPALSHPLPDLLLPYWNRHLATGFMPDTIWDRLTEQLLEEGDIKAPEKHKGGFLGWFSRK